jgi:heme exporter protein B
MLPLLKREIRNIFKTNLEVLNLLIFFIIVCFIYGFATSGNLSLQLSCSVLIVSFMLSSNLSSYNIFNREIETGMLEQLFLKCKTNNIILAKIFSQYICFALPLCLAIPFVSLLFKISPENIWILTGLVIITSFIISIFNVMIAALTAGIRNGSVISVILTIPLYIPLIIINLSFIESVANADDLISFSTYLINIFGFMLIILPLALFSAKVTVRNALN